MQISKDVLAKTFCIETFVIPIVYITHRPQATGEEGGSPLPFFQNLKKNTLILAKKIPK